MVDFETSNSKCEVSKSNSGKITSFSKNYGLQNSTTIVHRMTSRIAPGELLLVMLIYHLREYLRARQVISQINTWHVVMNGPMKTRLSVINMYEI